MRVTRIVHARQPGHKAPPGNQYAVGHGYGRPREYDRAKIANDLIEWAAKDDSININKFCCTYIPPLNPVKVMTWVSEDPDFRDSYNTAKAFLASRREEHLNTERLHPAAYNVNTRNYDLFLKDHHEKTLEHETKLKTEETKLVSEADAKRTEDLLEVMRNSQALAKDKPDLKWS